MTKQLEPHEMNEQVSIDAIEALVAESHGIATGAGWWNDKNGAPKDRNDGELIALMHSELSEALEGLRKDKQDEHLPEYKSVEVELADVLHRIFDYAGARKLNLAQAFVAKGKYNIARADHKPEERAKPGGKKF